MGLVRMAAVADDLTGAAGLAGGWAGRGRAVSVARSAGDLAGEAGCRILDVESRPLAAGAAALAVERAWASLGAAAVRFQKLDSTLRGNPGAEIGGLLAATGAPWVAVLPAYPSLGRNVLQGRVVVHGTPLERSEYARDPLTPARVHSVHALLPGIPRAHAPLAEVAGSPARLRRWLKGALRGRPRLVTFDCSEPGHTRAVAWACLAEGGRAFAGAADLGRALAARLFGPARPVRRPRGRWVALAGSVSATTFNQLESWRRGGGLWRPRIRRLPQGGWRVLERFPVPSRGDSLTAFSSLERRGDLAPWIRRAAAAGKERAGCAEEALAGLVRLGLSAAGGAPGFGWFATGGHTLRALDDACGFRLLRVLGEVLPEVPLGVAVGPRGRAWVCCKPGGFGSEDVFQRFMGAGA